ncbi:MAG: ABC transporter substrate-binding protein [Bacteroidetes bacterium]|nr:ABC transporter substrate-binding protein [Bacteroidota bacterium]
MIFTDQLGNTIFLPEIPKRIVSIVPSQTELLFDLGLDEEIIGITKYCVHPQHWLETKINIGGTKKLNLEKIKELKPDLIIGNKEENEKNQIQELMKQYPVWMSDIKNLEEALKMIDEVGTITGKEKRALEIQNNIREQFSHFKLATSHLTRITNKVLYLIWRKPYIVAGKDTFISHLLEICGFENVISKSRYPEISYEEIQKLNPNLIFLSSEPYPFRKKHVTEFQTHFQQAKVVLVDGEMFSWYGSRLLYAPSYFERLLKNL